MPAIFPSSSGSPETVLDELVLPLGGGNIANLLGASIVNFQVANRARGCRVVVRKTGTLRDLMVYVSSGSVSVPGAHVDLAIYSTDSTRQRLWSSGSLTPIADDAWFVVDPQIAVTAGDQLDFAFSFDAACSCAVVSFPEGQAADLPDGYLSAAGGALPLLAWQSNGSFPLPATLAEGSLTLQAICPILIARVA